MSQLGTILDSYENGLNAMNKGNYLIAARFFRICNYSYQYGELPMYMEKADKYGLSSYDMFKECILKLSKEQQEMLRQERIQHYRGKWRNGVNYDYEQIYSWYMNKYKEKNNLL